MFFKPKFLLSLFLLLALGVLSLGCCRGLEEYNVPEGYNNVSFSFISLSSGGYLLYNDATSPYRLEQLRIWDIETNRNMRIQFDPQRGARVKVTLDTIPGLTGEVTRSYSIQLADLPPDIFQVTFEVREVGCKEYNFFSEAFLNEVEFSPSGGRIIKD